MDGAAALFEGGGDLPASAPRGGAGRGGRSHAPHPDAGPPGCRQRASARRVAASNPPRRGARPQPPERRLDDALVGRRACSRAPLHAAPHLHRFEPRHAPALSLGRSNGPCRRRGLLGGGGPSGEGGGNAGLQDRDDSERGRSGPLRYQLEGAAGSREGDPGPLASSPGGAPGRCALPSFPPEGPRRVPPGRGPGAPGGARHALRRGGGGGGARRSGAAGRRPRDRRCGCLPRLPGAGRVAGRLRPLSRHLALRGAPPHASRGDGRGAGHRRAPDRRLPRDLGRGRDGAHAGASPMGPGGRLTRSGSLRRRRPSPAG